jgi:hypothetical protein
MCENPDVPYFVRSISLHPTAPHERCDMKPGITGQANKTSK